MSESDIQANATRKSKTMSSHEPTKHFEIRMPLKEHIHFAGRDWLFREREVWWMAIGENIGTEVNGKGDNFLRPVLIVRKYGARGFFGIPLSSQMHDGIWYARFTLKDKEQCALLSQAGSFSSYRLYGFMGRVSKATFRQMVEALEQLIFKK